MFIRVKPNQRQTGACSPSANPPPFVLDWTSDRRVRSQSISLALVNEAQLMGSTVAANQNKRYQEHEHREERG
jgi:hypothetical protein